MKDIPTSRQRATQHLKRLRRINARLATTVRRLTRDIAQARHFAHHDSLTGLPNRSLLLDRLGQALAQAARSHKRVMLLVIDLDGFKLVNDAHGHSVGDELLRQVAARLLSCVRFCDTVCRYGGDEFVVMLPQVDAAEDADIMSKKIKARLVAPYVLSAGSVFITASIGTAVYRVDGKTCSELIDRADAAMYIEKTRRKSSAPDAPMTLA